LAFTVAGAAKSVGVSERTIIEAVDARRLKARRIDGRAVLLATDLQLWLDQLPSYLTAK
jgi:excisionase family DNA binding protein